MLCGNRFDLCCSCGLILGLMGGTNDTADTDMYYLVDTINVTYPYLSSLKFEWIEAALVFSIIFTEICSFVGASVIIGRIGCES